MLEFFCLFFWFFDVVNVLIFKKDVVFDEVYIINLLIIYKYYFYMNINLRLFKIIIN